MHILVTNDDGIRSVGLRALADAALAAGHQVTVVAPAQQCSANSQHLTLTKPLLVRENDWEGAKAFSVEGTPSDCVRLAPYLVESKFDFCLSGINNGQNAGTALYYSGTAAAAREAVMLYVPAMAVSICQGADDAMRQKLAGMCVQMAEKLAAVPMPRYVYLNVNAPALPPEQWKPFTICPLSTSYFLDTYERRESPLGRPYFWLSTDDTSGVPMEPHQPGTDCALLDEGHVTGTFVGYFQDHNDALGALFEVKD